LRDVVLNNEVVKISDNYYGLKWKQDYKDKGFTQYFDGFSKFKMLVDENKNIIISKDVTELTNNKTTIKLLFAHTKLNEKDKIRYKVVASCPSPFVVIDSLNGVYFLDTDAPKVIDEVKKVRFTFGPYIGLGFNVAKDLNTVGLGYSFGLCLQYNMRWSDIKNIFIKK
jgi:hypothetical protein